MQIIFMKLFTYFLVIVFICIAGCTDSPPASRATIQTDAQQEVVTVDETKVIMSQTIYVPIYSHIYHDDQGKIFNLAATLSIRNTDLNNSMIVTAVRYYNSNGNLVTEYLERPIQIEALASTDFVVNSSDSSGGSGANFIVEWVAETQISEPIVEAVMIGTAFQQGISFISPGKVIKNQNKRQ